MGNGVVFFQFVLYNDEPSEPNVKTFDVKNLSFGVLQEYDDFENKLTFANVNSYSDVKTKRSKKILILPLSTVSSSKSYTNYRTV